MKKIAYSVSSLFLLAPAAVFAAVPVFDTADKVRSKICDLANLLYSIGLVGGVLATLYAAYKYYRSAGDAKGLAEAHAALTWAIVGIAIVIISTGMPSIVASILGGTSGNGC